MGKSLVIVESPSKAKTINKILGPGYVVKSSVGHVKDLPKRELGVDVAKGFKPKYVTIQGKTKVLKEITDAAKSSEMVFIAADPDREGEAICWHLANEIKKVNPNIQRVLFHEITKDAVRAAFEHPGVVNLNKVNAQQARRVLDRLVGYMVSPLLWKKVEKGLSAGRVQTVALRIICERQREIDAFVPEDYWNLLAQLSAKIPPPFGARLVAYDSKKLVFGTDQPGEKEMKVTTEEQAERLRATLSGQKYVVSNVEKKKKSRTPPPPFITSTMQQEASKKLGYSASRTMRLAQDLYEGIEIGKEGPTGLITYMRTDSTRIAKEAQDAAQAFVLQQYGKEYAGKPRLGKGAQDAHEAVRPTSMEHTPDAVASYLNRDQLKLYTLIWNRFLASQMAPAEFFATTVTIEAGPGEFRATGQELLFEGFLKVYADWDPRLKKKTKEEEQEEAEREELAALPELKKGDVLKLESLEPKKSTTKPPPLFTEASLIKALEELGIGRPSTYASILAVIEGRDYVNKEGRTLRPTPLGTTVSDLLVKAFPDLFNVKFTARMEERLDQVEEGKDEWVETVKSFYTGFEKALRTAEKELPRARPEAIPTDIVCEKCGNKMLIRWSKGGEFLGCSNYPKCRNTAEFERKEDGTIVAKEPSKAEVDAEPCEKCGWPMVMRKGRYGEFLGCSNYPQCKNIRRQKKTGGSTGDGASASPEEVTGETCEKCGKPMAMKQGRFGPFLGCTGYPECKNIKNIPLGPCPEPGCDGQAVQRRSRKGVFYACTRYPDCKWTSNRPPEAVAAGAEE